MSRRSLAKIYSIKSANRMINHMRAYCRSYGIDLVIQPSKSVMDDGEPTQGIFRPPIDDVSQGCIVVPGRTHKTILYHTIAHEFVHVLQYIHTPAMIYDRWHYESNYDQLEIKTEQKALEILDIYGICTESMKENSERYVHWLKHIRDGIMPFDTSKYSTDTWR